VELGNFRNWFSGSAKDREMRETRAAWAEAQDWWRSSPLANARPNDLAIELIRREFAEQTERTPAIPLLVELCEASEILFNDEDIGDVTPSWDAIHADPATAVGFRQMLVRRRRYASDFTRIHGILAGQMREAYQALIDALPESCLRQWDAENPSFEVPLVELLEDPAAVVEALILLPYTDDTLRLDLFAGLRAVYARNLVAAAGLPPTADPVDNQHKLIMPSAQKRKSPGELVDLYLRGTPFTGVLEFPVPFHIPEESRFEHCHIVGGTGHGKTQLMQRMIHADLIAAQTEKRSVVVIDSQGDLINRLQRLALFSPDADASLADRLVVIDPADVEFPAALNLFEAHLDRLKEYRPVDRERVLNGVVELYETFFGALLGAELTQKQGVIFKYLARLMLTIPGATIHTLMQLMEDGKPFKPHMDKLEGSAAYFFQTEFFHPSFAATKKQILRRLWGVLSTPAFERMFAQPRNKLDLFQAMQDGKIILINTAKDLLKQEGSQLFGRFFIAMLAQAALERSTVDPDERTPTLVYVDEAQEYFGDDVETILNQARKYRVGLTLAHQALDQLSPRLRSVLHSNTSMKCVGGVSSKDARAMGDELHTTSEFIESMKRRPGKSEFAVWIKHQTPNAIRLTVPLGFLERQPILTEEEYEALLVRNRAQYCGTLADVSLLRPSPSSVDTPEPPRTRPEPSPPPPRTTPAEPDLPDTADAPPAEHVQTDASAPPRPRPTTPASPRTPGEQGKGGSQHRYVQNLIKGLAEERGFRAVIEEAVAGGQVDVGLHRGDLSIACEVSITSSAEYEAQNLAKCLRAGFSRIWSIAPDQRRQRAVRKAAEARLGPDAAAKIEFLTPEDVVLVLDDLTEPEPEEMVVRGYKVSVTRRPVSALEAEERRASIARIVARSTKRD
jgi:hypothetical protein